MGYDRHELSVLITDDDEIAAMNTQYRGIEKPTNVLAFPMHEGEFSDISPELLGDVVISAETAEREAGEAGITLDERMSQLLVHGILHLIGFDHETGEVEADEMEAKSLEILRRIETNQSLDAF